MIGTDLSKLRGLETSVPAGELFHMLE